MKKKDAAAQCFVDIFLCSQAIFSTYAPELGLDSDRAKKIACCFGSGISYCDQTCGAVTGDLMLIGLKHSKAEQNDNAAKDLSYDLAQQFVTHFKEKHGSIRCTDLIGCDLSDPGELQKAKDEQLFTSICRNLVHSAAEIIEDLLALNPETQ